MIEYKLLDSKVVVPICLHGGAIALSAIDKLCQETQFEKQFSLPNGSHALAFKKLAEVYGASGIVAIDDQDIVGLIRFYPRELRHLLGGHLCPQEEAAAKMLSAVMSEELPSFASLRPKALQIGCVQVCDQSQGKGVGSAMVERVISWATSCGWKELYSLAVDDIFPIMAWSGHMSDAMLMKRGFVTVEKQEDAMITEAALNMQQGAHGKEIQDLMEKQHPSISEGRTLFSYTMKLEL